MYSTVTVQLQYSYSTVTVQLQYSTVTVQFNIYSTVQLQNTECKLTVQLHSEHLEYFHFYFKYETCRTNFILFNGTPCTLFHCSKPGRGSPSSSLGASRFHAGYSYVIVLLDTESS